MIPVNQNNDSTFTSYSNLNVESNNTTTVSLNLDDINALNNDEICTIIPAIKYDKKYIPTINNTDTIYSIKTEYKSLFVNSLSNIDNIINSIYADNFKINKLPDYTIHLDAVNNKFPITIFDLTGNLIYKGTDNNIKLNKPGFYILKHNNIKTSFVINN